jgi:hypothetical protein
VSGAALATTTALERLSTGTTPLLLLDDHQLIILDVLLIGQVQAETEG